MTRDLFSIFLDLHTLLTQHQGDMKGIDMFQMYKGLVKRSSKGSDCTYARKCRRLIMENDLSRPELEALVREAEEIISGRQENSNKRIQADLPTNESSHSSATEA